MNENYEPAGRRIRSPRRQCRSPAVRPASSNAGRRSPVSATPASSPRSSRQTTKRQATGDLAWWRPGSGAGSGSDTPTAAHSRVRSQRPRRCRADASSRQPVEASRAQRRHGRPAGRVPPVLHSTDIPHLHRICDRPDRADPPPNGVWNAHRRRAGAGVASQPRHHADCLMKVRARWAGVGDAAGPATWPSLQGKSRRQERERPRPSTHGHDSH